METTAGVGISLIVPSPLEIMLGVESLVAEEMGDKPSSKLIILVSDFILPNLHFHRINRATLTFTTCATESHNIISHASSHVPGRYVGMLRAILCYEKGASSPTYYLLPKFS